MKNNKNELTSKEKIDIAFIDCLKEKKPVDEITVSYLIKKAGVGKSTFYRCYRDVFDIYEQFIDGFIERVEKLITRVFFEKSLSLNQALWILAKGGIHKDNELFLLSDAILISHSIENNNAKIIEIVYDRIYDTVVRIAKRVYDDDEAASFGATFALTGNIFPILSSFYTEGKLRFETIKLTLELFDMEVKKWEQHQNQE